MKEAAQLPQELEASLDAPLSQVWGENAKSIVIAPELVLRRADVAAAFAGPHSPSAFFTPAYDGGICQQTHEYEDLASSVMDEEDAIDSALSTMSERYERFDGPAEPSRPRQSGGGVSRLSQARLLDLAFEDLGDVL